MYRDEGERVQAVCAFIDEATAAAEPVLVALPGEHLDTVRDAMGAATTARYEDMRHVGRNPSRLLPLIEAWVADGQGDRVRVVSEPVWPGRSYPEIAECLRHEALVNDVLAESPATVLCPYDAGHLGADTLDGVELTHPTVLEGGRRRRSAGYRASADLDVDARWPLQPPSDPIAKHDLGRSLGELRAAVAADPLVATLSRDRRSDLVLAVNEAATNAVRHGDGGCTARIWHDGCSIVTEISSDTAVPDRLAGRARRPDAGAPSGRGLWLINEV